MRRSRPGAMRAAVAAASTGVVLLLAGCASDDPSGSGDGAPFAVDVDVDTPELRAAKEKAGIDDCPAVSRDAADPEPAEPLPDVTLPCLGGGPDVDLSALRGPMVVNLWAQWCGPCREELPHYQEFHEQAGDRVQVLGVDYQDTRPAWALDLLRETGVTYPSVADPAGVLREPLAVRGLPAILLVDADGNVVHQEFAVIESSDQLAGLVEEHLGVEVGTAG